MDSGINGSMTVSSKKETISERLQFEKTKLEQRLTEVNSALAILEKNPDVAQVIDTLSKVTYLNY